MQRLPGEPEIEKGPRRTKCIAYKKKKKLKEIYKRLTIKSTALRKKRDGFETRRRSDFKSEIQHPNQ